MKLVAISGVLLAAMCGTLLYKVMARSPARPKTAPVEEVAEATIPERPAPNAPYEKRQFSAAAPSAPLAPKPPVPGERQDDSRAPEIQALASSLRQRMATERPDPKWSTEMSSKLDADIQAAKLEHASSIQSRCGASVCEVKIRFDDDVDRNAVAMTVGSLPSARGGAFFEYDENKKESTIFVGRVGGDAFVPPQAAAM